jgi:hypothetical protein
MQNSTLKLSSEFAENLSNTPVKTATFKTSGRMFTFAPDMGTIEFLSAFPDHTRVYGLLNSSGSSWSDKAFAFYVADCFDPPLYLQFGSSFEDAYESFIDNEPSLLIPPEDLKDYGEADNYEGSFDSNGNPVDTERVQAISEPVQLVSVTF